MRKLLSNLLASFENKKKLHTGVILPILFFLILSIRFNGQDFLVDGFTMPDLQKGEFSIDIQLYIEYLEAFRNDSQIIGTVPPPFLYRPLSPLAASVLPFSPITSLNVVNVISLALSLFLMFSMVKRESGSKYAVLASYLMILSFPFLYYGSIGNIDPGSLFFVSLGIYIYRHYGLSWSLLLLPIAISQKEVTILYLFYIAGDLLLRKGLKWKIMAIALPLIGIGVYELIKALYPAVPFIWTPGDDFIFNNLTRARAYLAPGLSFGLPFLIILLMNKYIHWRLDFSYIIAIVAIFGLLAYAFVSAYVDGRFVFIGLSILCMYSVRLLKRYLEHGSEEIGFSRVA